MISDRASIFLHESVTLTVEVKRLIVMVTVATITRATEIRETNRDSIYSTPKVVSSEIPLGSTTFKTYVPADNAACGYIVTCKVVACVHAVSPPSMLYSQ